ncbi:MAG: rhomboid family intramembrane serine protease [Clostridiales bacterium]|nr:rhomboid family intramembrane serine protease [Clostridiales bacterium]
MEKKRRITFNSPVVLTFVVVSLGVMVLNYVTAGYSNKLLFMTYHSPLSSPMTFIRFFTHVLGHAGWNHYIGNMMYMLLLGPILEEKYGSRAIIEVMLVTAVVTGIFTWLFFPNIALCGASGIVFAFIMMTSFTGFREGEIPLTVILVAVIFIGQQVYEGLFMQDNISNMGHILGGIVGAAAGYLLNKKSVKELPDQHRTAQY